MLKREIKYTDFNDQEQTDVIYFNFSKAELLELQSKYPGGLEGLIERIINERDNNELVKLFKQIILDAYGVKSEDGRSFLKNEELKRAFEQTAAYQELFLQLAEKDGAAIEFLNGILPKDMRSSDQEIAGLKEAGTQRVGSLTAPGGMGEAAQQT